MLRSSFTLLIVAVIFLCFVVVPVCAVIQEVTFKGVVATVNQPTNTLTVNNPAQYGCTNLSSGGPVCTWTPFSVSVLTGTVPDPAVFTVFKPGDTVVGTSAGGADDTWLTLAKLYGSRPNEEFVTDIIGDPGTIPVPLIGNYALDISPNPDCSRCSGVTCTAVSAHVIILSRGMVVAEKVLSPGGILAFNSQNDGSSVSVTFVNGQALYSTCPQAQAGTVSGTRTVSDYIIQVVPPVAYGQINLRTATTTSPVETLLEISDTASAASPTPTIPVASAPSPTKSGSLPFAVAGAVGLTFLAFSIKKR